MKAVFVELPAFECHRPAYMDEAVLSDLQDELMKSPRAGDLIKDSGGLRKLRFSDTLDARSKR